MFDKYHDKYRSTVNIRIINKNSNVLYKNCKYEISIIKNNMCNKRVRIGIDILSYR